MVTKTPAKKSAHKKKHGSVKKIIAPPGHSFTASTKRHHQPQSEPDVVPMMEPFSEEKWSTLIQATFEHPQFVEKYSFPSTSPGWTQTKPGNPNRQDKLKKYPRVVSLDCEMCVTQHKITGERDSRALARASLVDGENPENVLVDVIVRQPQDDMTQILDYKTDVHGITPALLHASSCSFRDAQKKILKFITEDTIVVGQSVYGDLAALKIEHYHVVDTAFIFKRKGDTTGQQLPGLKDLANDLLQMDLPEIHDSTLDAKICLKAALWALDHGVHHEVERVLKKSHQQQHESSKLRIHYIPQGLTPTDLQNRLVELTHILPMMIENIQYKDAALGQHSKTHVRGSTSVIYSSSAHAALAFETLEGAIRYDSIQRPEKSIRIERKNTSTGVMEWQKLNVGKMTKKLDVEDTKTTTSSSS